MYRLLIRTCLVLSVLQQYGYYQAQSHNHDNQQYLGDNGTQGTDNKDSSQISEYTEKGKESQYIDGNQVQDHTEGQKSSYIDGRQKSEYTGISYKPKLMNTDKSPENIANLTQSESNHIFTNQSDERKADVVEIGDNYAGTDRETDGDKGENIMKQNTEVVIIKKLSDVNENRKDLKSATVHNIHATDKDKQNNQEERNRENNEVMDIIAAICGEHYTSCTQTTYGSRIFKDSSICKTCSCNAKTCHISKNCCPDVQVDSNDIEDDTASMKVCATLSNVLSFTKTNEGLREDNGMNVTAKKEIKKSSLRLNLTKPTGYPDLYNSGKTEKVLLASEKTHVFNSPSLFKGLLGVVDNKSEKEIKENVKKGSIYNETADEQYNKQFQILNEEQKTFSELAISFFPMYLVTNTCPREYTNADIIAKCEAQASSILLDNIPVSDWFTMNVYRNKWCAKCHNVSAPEKWRLVTDCLQLYTTDYIPSLVTDFNNLTKNCTVRVIPPTGLGTEVCQTFNDPPVSSIVDTCNITGLWKENVTIIEKLCKNRNYMSFYKDNRLGADTIYKNIFCYTCNTDVSLQTLGDKRHQDSDIDSTYWGRRLYMDINIADPTEQSAVWFREKDQHNLTCPRGQIPDVYTEDCIQFECPIYQTSMSNLCLDRERDVTGLVLTSMMQLQFHAPVHSGQTKDEISDFGRKVADGIDDKMQISKIGCEVRHVKMYTNPHSSQGYIQEALLVYKIANTEKCSVKHLVSIYTKLDTDIINVTVKLGETPRFPIYSPPRQYQTFSVGLSFKTIHNYEIETTLTEKSISYEIRLSKKFYCPKVLITQSKYKELAQKGHLTKTLQLNGVGPTEQIPICYSKYLENWLLEMYEMKSTIKQKHSSLTDTLSMISTIVSMTSIIIVLVTYSMFTELRFIPGKLFMVLCFNLLLAQGFYSFGLDLGVDNIWCQLVGICIHMLWLATMFSMNSCLWLMLKNLKDPLGSENRECLQSKSNYQVFKYSCYCYTMSAFCVLTNIILSHSIYNDDHYGYGSKLCYINTRQMRIFTFALPIALVLIINFFMFMRIMSKISKMMHMKHNALVKAQILIFLKLSTISGFYWSFGFIYEATQIKAFEHLFIVLNGGQGFFLMWSFLFNKRIMVLYKKVCKKLCLKNEDESFSEC